MGALMAQSHCPVRLARGERDHMVTLDQLRAYDPQARDLPGGHNAMVENPGAVAGLDRRMTDFDLRNLPPDFHDDPFSVYRRLRETTPVARLPDGGVFLTRYADALAVYQDPDTFRSDKKSEFAPKYGAESRLFRHHTTSLVFNDAPYHTRVRRAIMGALIPRALAPLEPKLETLVSRLLDPRCSARHDGGDHRFRRRHSGRGNRRPPRGARCGSRAVARLVARDPGRARTRC